MLIVGSTHLQIWIAIRAFVRKMADSDFLIYQKSQTWHSQKFDYALAFEVCFVLFCFFVCFFLCVNSWWHVFSGISESVTFNIFAVLKLFKNYLLLKSALLSLSLSPSLSLSLSPSPSLSLCLSVCLSVSLSLSSLS